PYRRKHGSLPPGESGIGRVDADRPIAVVSRNGAGRCQAFGQHLPVILRVGATLGQIDHVVDVRLFEVARAGGCGRQHCGRSKGSSSGHALPFMIPALTSAVRIAFKSVNRIWALSWASVAACTVVSLRIDTSVVVALEAVESVIAACSAPDGWTIGVAFQKPSF